MNFQRDIIAMNEDMAETQLMHTIKAEYTAKYGKEPQFVDIELVGVIAKMKTNNNHKSMRKYKFDITVPDAK